MDLKQAENNLRDFVNDDSQFTKIYEAMVWTIREIKRVNKLIAIKEMQLKKWEKRYDEQKKPGRACSQSCRSHQSEKSEDRRSTPRQQTKTGPDQRIGTKPKIL